MSEIKFACPHCAQHIACDSDYADMCIVCPGCGKPMVVPILSAMDAAHPEICLVAATPALRPKFRSRIPALDPWTEDEWERHAAETPDPGFGRPLPLLIFVLMLLPMLAMFLMGVARFTGGLGLRFGVILIIVCSGLAAWLAVRKLQRGVITRWITGVVVMSGLMVMQIGMLSFAGCCAVGID